MTGTNMPGPSPTKRRPKWALIVALVLFLLGIGGCAGGLIAGVGAVSSLADDVARTTPMGESTTFEATGGGKAGVLLTSTAVCEGSSDDGDAIRFDEFSGTTTVDTGDEQFNDLLTFDTVEGRTYTLTCGSSGGGEYTVLQLPSIFTTGWGIALVGGGIVIGAVSIVLAIIFLIVGLVQRSNWKKKNQGPGGPGVYGAGTQYAPPTPGQSGASPWNAPPGAGQGQPPAGPWVSPPGGTRQGPPPAPPQQTPPPAPPSQTPPPPPPPDHGGEPPAPPLR